LNIFRKKYTGSNIVKNMRELTPLKVKIGLRVNGHADYPDFNLLQVVQDSGMDWSKYVDAIGLSWHYDKTSGHKEDTQESPHGQQWGVLIIPKEFADQAVAMFSDTCTKLTEAELEDFYNNKATINQADEDFDQKMLDGIKTKQDLGIALTPHQLKAIDPEDDTPGITKNKKKVWKDFKKLSDVKIVQ